MKPWTNPCFHAQCYICGQMGWNRNALDAWTGSRFRCTNGCYPEDVRRYQEKLARERTEREAKRNADKVDYESSRRNLMCRLAFIPSAPHSAFR